MLLRNADTQLAAGCIADPLARFAHHLPFRVRCTDDLETGLAWAPRGVALLQREIAPDPDGWRTSLRLDVDCPCEGQPHAQRGVCPRAATFWRDAALPEPTFVIVNPRNGHAHYVYVLRGWIRVDGADHAQLAAVRYFAAIERAYTRVARADPGYASLVHHNPLSRRYETIVGRAEPYSLRELASYVVLASAPRRREPEIRVDGRNVETFDRLRFWAYGAVGEWRCGAYAQWADVVAERALVLAADARRDHPRASHAFTDREALGIAKSVAGWVWLRYDGAQPALAAARAAVRRARDRERAVEARRARGSVPRDVYLATAARRRLAARTLCSMGVAVDEIARRLGAGVRSVYRWIAELRLLPGPSAPSDFKPGEPADERTGLAKKDIDRNDGAVVPSPSSSHGTSAGSPLGCRGEYELPARSAEPSLGPADNVRPAPQTVDLLAYARDRLYRAPVVPVQGRLFDSSSDVAREPTIVSCVSAAIDDNSSPRYQTVLSHIRGRIADIRDASRHA